MIRQVRCGLGHSERVARGAHATAIAGEGHQKVMPAVGTVGARNTVSIDGAVEVFGKGLSDVIFRQTVIEQQKARTVASTGFEFMETTSRYLRAGGKSVQIPCATPTAMPMLSPGVGCG